MKTLTRSVAALCLVCFMACLCSCTKETVAPQKKTVIASEKTEAGDGNDYIDAP